MIVTLTPGKHIEIHGPARIYPHDLRKNKIRIEADPSVRIERAKPDKSSQIPADKP